MNARPSQRISTAIAKNDRKTINAWAMYDWANSAYALVIVSAIFPAYYNTITSADGTSTISLFGLSMENTAAYSINLGIAFGLIALISPLLSSISDYSSNHRSYMQFFCYLGAGGSMLLFFFTDYHLVYLGLGGMLLATVGYSGSIVFYNSYLPVIATEDRQDKVSARGYAFGYIGATTLLIINLVFILNQQALGVTDDTLFPRLSFLLTGLWWLGFAQIPFRVLPRGLYTAKPVGNRFTQGYKKLKKVWQQLQSQPRLKTFLFSFFFYIMGVQTVMFMASSFGEKEIHLGLTQLIVTVLLLEYLGIGGAFLFAWISKKTSNITALMISVGIWIMICAGSYFIITPIHFYIAAFFIGIVMGGIQSLSRSTFAKMIPKTGSNAAYFSFYDVCEKTAMMFGLVMFGYLDNLTGSMRNSIIALAIWFTIGLVLLFLVDKARPARQTIPS
ncbi:MFS transporter [Flavilitoribacter nigricans]|uniref:MFS transporter n=1 Tax=Flavilitoribacter nigricans (strain ATCC 23147 / DSM 23189 / NBRC 102662 / NCIMB 1420 / SS-2) TaxID=1122177 RepID=A0A2D0N5I0_FLAN2|nr:MFS transporter [Flavilitoribacter nigricans]PHN03697.1 MFS transporter [Flavilitoribacter nigricans DSM 23189 = NBRC 102662]